MKMEIDEIDEYVKGAIPYGDTVTREQISDIVLDQMLDLVRKEVLKQILPAIDRVVAKGGVIEDRDCLRGRPYTYMKEPMHRRGHVRSSPFSAIEDS